MNTMIETLNHLTESFTRDEILALAGSGDIDAAEFGTRAIEFIAAEGRDGALACVLSRDLANPIFTSHLRCVLA